MKIFYKWLGLSMAVLLVYSACDSGVGGDNPIVSPPIDYAKSGESYGKMGSIDDAIDALEDDLDEYLDNIPEFCKNPTFTQTQLEDFDQRIDDVLSDLGPGINQHNLIDHIDDLDSTDWARFDTTKVAGIFSDFKDLYPSVCSMLHESIAEILVDWEEEWGSVIETADDDDAVNKLQEAFPLENSSAATNDFHGQDHHDREECLERCEQKHGNLHTQIGAEQIGAVSACAMDGAGLSLTVLRIPHILGMIAGGVLVGGATGLCVGGFWVSGEMKKLNNIYEFQECQEKCPPETPPCDVPGRPDPKECEPQINLQK